MISKSVRKRIKIQEGEMMSAFDQTGQKVGTQINREVNEDFWLQNAIHKFNKQDKEIETLKEQLWDLTAATDKEIEVLRSVVQTQSEHEIKCGVLLDKDAIIETLLSELKKSYGTLREERDEQTRKLKLLWEYIGKLPGVVYEVDELHAQLRSVSYQQALRTRQPELKEWPELEE